MLEELEPGQKLTIRIFGQTYEWTKQRDGSFIKTI
jgi:hypothetical protein